ncbi:hypothetical protein BC6307_21040 [Sutcliffiella cohnii]|uniref:JmjC domain-containing protein n=1 Tax=Sutcliffiella cohnii TaxID=33932 RepID=A0A223KW41_9BACI|nr:cupin domain-containing protein [Sutcliffiella cohnii]AST93574.1 hypothetical protein BC6307_21040 [Sutcliffiella cohnii]
MSREIKSIKEIRNLNDITMETLKAPFIIRNFLSQEMSERILSQHILSFKNSNKLLSASRKNGSETRFFDFAEYIIYMNRDNESDPWYASNLNDKEIIDGVMEHIDLPKTFDNWLDALPDEVKPYWLWVFLGPSASSTKLHIDVMMSSAWNLLYSGLKKWKFLSPSESIQQNILGESYQPYFNSETFEIDVLQRPGDLVFTPSGWAHEVVNVKSTVSITGNFINESNYSLAKQYLEERQKIDWLKVMNKLESINIGGDI